MPSTRSDAEIANEVPPRAVARPSYTFGEENEDEAQRADDPTRKEQSGDVSTDGRALTPEALFDVLRTHGRFRDVASPMTGTTRPTAVSDHPCGDSPCVKRMIAPQANMTRPTRVILKLAIPTERSFAVETFRVGAMYDLQVVTVTKDDGRQRVIPSADGPDFE